MGLALHPASRDGGATGAGTCVSACPGTALSRSTTHAYIYMCVHRYVRVFRMCIYTCVHVMCMFAICTHVCDVCVLGCAYIRV